MSNGRAVRAAIERRRFRYTSERELHDGLAAALAEDGMEVRREVRLSSTARVDLLVGRVAIEVKTAPVSASKLAQQLRRYADSNEVDELVLVTNRALRNLPRDLDGWLGVPLYVVKLLAGGL